MTNTKYGLKLDGERLGVYNTLFEAKMSMFNEQEEDLELGYTKVRNYEIKKIEITKNVDGTTRTFVSNT